MESGDREPGEESGCHPERAKRVEGSSALAAQYGQFIGKILRLRAPRYAQDDSRVDKRRKNGINCNTPNLKIF